MAFFFFYGTLAQATRNRFAFAIAPHLDHGRPATVRGRLAVIATADGCYPILEPGNGVVRGQLHRTRPSFDARLMAMLDAYEDCRPRLPQASEYARRRCPVRLSRGGKRLAFVYCGTRRGLAPRIGKRTARLHHGDFERFLQETGQVAFGGEAQPVTARRRLRFPRRCR